MDELSVLASSFGYRGGRSAPMAASKAAAGGLGASVNHGSGSGISSASNAAWNRSRSGSNSTVLRGDFGGGISETGSPPPYGDIFGTGGSTGYSNPSSAGWSAPSSAPPAVNSILEGYNDSGPKSSTLPVFDKPLYDDDDDLFEGIPGIKSSGSVDIFGKLESESNRVSPPPQFEDLLENLGRSMPESKGASDNRSAEEKDPVLSEFDELIPGFGGSNPPRRRESPEAGQPKPSVSSVKPTVSAAEDPFVVLESASTAATSSAGLFTDPLEHLSRPMDSGSTRFDSPINDIFDQTNVFEGLQNSIPSFTANINEIQRDKNPLDEVQNGSTEHQFSGKEPLHVPSLDAFENILPKTHPTKLSNSQTIAGGTDLHDSERCERNATTDQSPKSYEHFETADDVWLTVAEIPLLTQPTSAPPPSRLPPPLIIKQGPFGASAKTKDKEYFSQSNQSYSYTKDSTRRSVVSPIDELEDFAMGRPQTYAQDRADIFSSEEFDTNSAAAASAAAMKEAMDRAEAKFKHAKEVRERERDAKFSKNRESVQQEKDEKANLDGQDLEDKEKQERLDWEREQRERQEKEKEQKRLQKERELELERENARKAVERATREARERAATEARLKAEKAAVEKANAEARQRAERAAVQRAAAEARERAAAEARERAEKAAAEAREKAARERAANETREKAAAEARERAERAAVERAAAEARLRAERAAVERAAAEARERAAAEARERAAVAAREKQQKPEDDLETFFSMGSRANSAPKQRATSSSDTIFDAQAQNKGGHNGAQRASSVSSSTIRKASSTTNFVNDLNSIFGGAPSSEEFQDIEGESEERRRARLERHQRTLERAAKALAEKNQRDLQSQREQAERHRIAETLDVEIKRWAAGKEGNLRALLSTMQYVLWPECGWQPVSLTDLITAAAVKKVYRKATLCIHPDKVQQKGATLQQKYIAEKVFDLLKEAWNKFNSEELF